MRYAAFILAVSVSLLVACKPENEPEPLGSRLDSPAGVALLGTSHLLVTNANFQLRYSGGTLAAIDLALVDESARFNDVETVVSDALELPSFVGPVALDPAGTTAMVTNRLSEEGSRSSPDRVFLVDVTNPALLVERTPSHLFVDRDPYGILPMRLPPAGPGRPIRDRAIVANASGSSLALLSLTPETRCADGAEAPCVDDAFPPPRGTQPVFTDAGAPADLEFVGPGLAPGITRNERWIVTFVEAGGVCPVPTSPEVPAGYWRVEGSVSGILRGHACTGEQYLGDNLRVSFTVSRAANEAGVPTGAPPTEGDRWEFETYEGDLETVSFLELGRHLPIGTIFGRGVGQLAYDPLRGRIYGTSRRTNFVYVVRADDLLYHGAFAIQTNTGGNDSRGIAVSPDGGAIYVVNRSPNALLFLDPDAMDDGIETEIVFDGVVDSVPLEEGASEIEISPDGRYAYVSCFDADRVLVVDLVNRIQIGSIPTADGPFGMQGSADGRRMYVASYFDHAIEVIDTDPASPTFLDVLTVIANAGFDPDR